MNPQTSARILLTIVLTVPFCGGLYWASTNQYLLWSTLAVILSLVALVWLWKPWRWLKR